MKKREFLKISGMVAAGLMLNPLSACKTISATQKKANGFIDSLLQEKGELILPPLGYDFKALEPHIDAMTMEIHHDKHHAAYIKKWNEAIKGSTFAEKTLAEVFASLTTAKENNVFRNNGGGHYNHSLFWSVLGLNNGSKPTGKLAEAITRDFGSFEKFAELIKDAGLKQFGSGWAWLCVNADKKLFICATPNQDNPLMAQIVDKEKQGTPVFGIDVWEHAYYLKYVNERKKYLEAIFNVLDWAKIGKRFELITA